MGDPPIDNADPRDEHNELLKAALREMHDALVPSHSDEHLRNVAGSALARIEELERIEFMYRDGLGEDDMLVDI